MVKQKTFANGLRLIVNGIDGAFSVSCGVLVGAGSRYETPETNGISHFIEHMTFKGTERRTAFDVSEEIDAIGGQINAFTTKETTCYYVKSTEEHIAEAVDVLSDIFFDSTFDEGEMEREKKVILEEINMSDDTPDDLCLDVLSLARYGEEGLGATILGTAENVCSFTKKQAFSYKNAMYRPENTVVCFSGHIDIGRAEELAEKYFAEKFKAGKFVPPVLTHTVGYAEKFVKKEIEQAHIGIAYDGCRYNGEFSDHYMMINTALGGGMSSVLFQKVREELGLAYSVYSFVSSYLDSGSLCVYAGVNPKNTQVALDCIFGEISAFKQKGLTQREFDRAKEQIKSGFVFSQESNSSQMLLYSKFLLFTGELFDFEKKMASINSVTKEELNEFIKDRLDLSRFAKAIVSR